MEEIMKSCKCLMGVVLTTILFFGSVFASNTISNEVKDGFLNKGQISVFQDKQILDELNGNSIRSIRLPENGTSERGCEDCEFDWTNYGSECCDSAWDEYGLNCADLEANYNWDCAGCLCPGDEEGECGDGTCNVNEDCESCESDCGVCGECGDGEVPDFIIRNKEFSDKLCHAIICEPYFTSRDFEEEIELRDKMLEKFDL